MESRDEPSNDPSGIGRRDGFRPGSDGDPTTRIVRGVRAGEVGSLDALVERLTPLLESQARFRLARLPEIDVLDAVQEVWLRAIPALGDLESRDGRFTPVVVRYLANTLLNLSREWKRQAIRSRRVGRRPDEGERWSPTTSFEDPASVGVVSRAIRRERGDALRALLDNLEPADRELLVLRGIEQHDNKDVAAVLRVSPNAVSLRYNRLLDRLRRQLRGTVLDDLADAPG